VTEYYVIGSPSHLMDASYGKQSATVRAIPSDFIPSTITGITEYSA